MLDAIIVYVVDQRTDNQNQKKNPIKVSLKDSLKEFKKKVEKKLWIDKNKVMFLSKGKFLRGEENMLEDLGIKDRQQIMMLEKPDFEDELEENKRH